MAVIPYLSFDGRCAEAFRFYEQLLGGRIAMIMTWGESPIADQVSADWSDRVIHATLELDGGELLASDAPPSHYSKPQGFSLSLQTDDLDKAERMFAGLAEGGEIQMPLAETFWAKRFGMVTDRFGIPWMVNCGDKE